MLEPVLLGFLALAGIACTAILAFVLVHSGWRLDRRRAARTESERAPSPPRYVDPALGGHRPEEIFSIMREHFPAEYERYRRGGLGAVERRWVWESCCAIADARVEIEEICG